MDLDASGTLAIAVTPLANLNLAMPVDPAEPIDALIARAVTAADLPRKDFQGNPLPWRLFDGDGTPLDATPAGPAGPGLTLDAEGAAEVIRKRDGWLADLEAQVDSSSRPAGGSPIHARTMLSLVRRTESRAESVRRLEAGLGSTTAPAAAVPLAEAPAPRRWPGRVAGALGGLTLLALCVWTFGGFAWLDRDEPAASDAEEVDGVTHFSELPAEAEGFIGAPGQDDLYTFDAPAGALVRIDMASPRAQIDTELYLHNADDDRVAENDDALGGAGGLNSRIDYEVPETGRYTVHAHALGFNGIGPYVLSIVLIE